MIKTEQLRYLIELNRTNSFHKCAKNLNLSQPAISLAIQNLEKELNVELFTRTSSGVYPTPVGKQVVKKAKKIMENVDEIYLRVNEYKTDSTKTVKKVSFYAVETILSSVMPSVLLRLQKQYPGAKIASKEWDDDSMRAIMKDAENVGLQYYWEDDIEELKKKYPDICFELMCPLKFFLAMDENAPFLTKEPINLDQAEETREGFPVVLYARSTNPSKEVMDLLVKEHNAKLIFQAPTEKLFGIYIKQGLGAGLIVQYGTNKLLPNNPAREQFEFIPLETKRNSGFYMLTNSKMDEELHQRISNYMKFGIEFL